jgi:5-methylcytosine-specific restriction endonuclease McrA
MKPITVILGREYGRLTPLLRGPNDNQGKPMWYCSCSCGKFTLVRGTCLNNGSTRSCGCLRNEVTKSPDECKKRSKRIREGKRTPEGRAHAKEQGVKISGPNHYKWKGGITPENDAIRKSIEYKNWRSMVYERDNYSCQDLHCRQRKVRLNAHHIFSFSEWEELRLDIDNGITLCKDCHKWFKGRGTYDHIREESVCKN